MTYIQMCLMLCLAFTGGSGEKRLGLYEIELLSSQNCDVPGAKKAPHSIPVDVETYMEGGHHLVRWNLTVPRLIGPMQTRSLVYILRNKVFQKAFDKISVPCENIILKTIMNFGKIRYTKNCYIKKGLYHNDRFDINEMLHLVNRVMLYGTVKVRYEWFAPQGVWMCLEGVAVSKPLNVTARVTLLI